MTGNPRIIVGFEDGDTLLWRRIYRKVVIISAIVILPLSIVIVASWVAPMVLLLLGLCLLLTKFLLNLLFSRNWSMWRYSKNLTNLIYLCFLLLVKVIFKKLYASITSPPPTIGYVLIVAPD